MVLEATVICIDNSEWMRNGDSPTRLEAQRDAANLICYAKTQGNPESSVAIMTMAQTKGSARADVLVTLTQDIGKLLNCMHSLKIGGKVDFSSAMQVAQLVLKHRQNKNQHQRIICIVGSPVTESTEELVKLATKLKKNNIAVDVVNFGDEAVLNVDKLEAFHSAVNQNNESHLQTVPPGSLLLSDVLVSSPIVGGSDAGGAPIQPMDGLDDDLAEAIKQSLALAALQEKEAADAAIAQSKPAETKQEGEEKLSPDEEEERAILMSLGIFNQVGVPPASEGASQAAPPADTTQPTPMQVDQGGEQMTDDEFLADVIKSLPGVDANDERIRMALSSIGSGEKKEEKKDNNPPK